MQYATTGRALAALLAGGLFLGACGNGNVSTSTPTSTLGTDSAATKVGGTSSAADTAATTTTMGVPADRTVTTPANYDGHRALRLARPIAPAVLWTARPLSPLATLTAPFLVLAMLACLTAKPG